MSNFKLKSNFSLSDKQLLSVNKIVENYKNNIYNQTLKGVTGCGKTFIMANIIKKLNVPALIMCPNKILAAQLYEEFKLFFPDNAVEYFVSYYDYYRPESYLPSQGLYFEKESCVNEAIDRLRHHALRNLLTRKDTIIIASVSCLYGLSPYQTYLDSQLVIKVNDTFSIPDLSRNLLKLSYEQSFDLSRGKYKIQGNYIFIAPSHILDRIWKIKIEKKTVIQIEEQDPLNISNSINLNEIILSPNSLHIVIAPSMSSAFDEIRKDLGIFVNELRSKNKFREAERITERVNYDIEQMKNFGYCSGIENYSRYFSGAKAGSAPCNIFEYFPKDFIHFIDESHISIPQIRSMSIGNDSRKKILIDNGFRLPSARDNRPLKYEEWNTIRPKTVFVSATPSNYDIEQENIIEQIIRPTGLLDPICEIHKTVDQILDSIKESEKIIAKGEKVLMLTLTKKTAENLTDYLKNQNFKVSYLHGELKTLERVEVIYNLKKGNIDIIVGVNLLREGIDLPECSLLCVFEADQEGFLRTENALIQMIGRVARNCNGKVILYADKITNSMEKALEITRKRRELQIQYNKENNIIPKTIIKSFNEVFSPLLTGNKEIKKFNK